MGVLSDIGRSNALGDATGVLYKGFMQNLSMRDAAGTAGVKNATDLVQLEQHQRAQEIATRRADEELAIRKATAEREAAKSRPVFLDNYAKAKWGKVPGLSEFMIGKLSPFAEEGPAGPMIPLDVLRDVNGKLLTDKEFLAESNRVISTGTKERMSEYYDEIGKLGQKLKEEAAAAGPTFDPTKSATYAQLMEVSRKHSKLSELGGNLHEEYKRLTGSKDGEDYTLAPGAQRRDKNNMVVAENTASGRNDKITLKGFIGDKPVFERGDGLISWDREGAAPVKPEEMTRITPPLMDKEMYSFDEQRAWEPIYNNKIAEFTKKNGREPDQYEKNIMSKSAWDEVQRTKAVASQTAAPSLQYLGPDANEPGNIVRWNPKTGKMESVKGDGAPEPKTLGRLPAAEAKSLATIKTLLADTKAITQEFKSSLTGPFAGNMGALLSKVKNGPEFERFRRKVARLITVVYGMSGKQINENEMEIFRKDILPSVQQPDKNFLVAVDELDEWLKRNYNNNVEAFNMAGYVTTGLSLDSAPAAPGKSGKKRVVYNPSTGRLE